MSLVKPEIMGLLACPRCGAELSEMVRSLRCDSGHLFPVVDGVPVFLETGRDVPVREESHQSHQPTDGLLNLFADLPGPWLHLGAGATEERYPGSIELETVIFRNTDVVADGANMPFRPGSLHGFLALNVFEHLPDPGGVAREVNRVLVPRSPVAIQTAFMQPLHSDPGHFYNATEEGIRRWFRDFTVDAIEVPPNFHPAFAFAWMASDLLYWSRPTERDDLEKLTLGELAEFWSDSASRHGSGWDAFHRMPANVRRILAAGFELRARSRGPRAD